MTTPQPESPFATFAAHCERGELAYQLDESGLPLWPPQVRGAGWRVSDGLGTVYATTTVHRPDEDPYDLSLVDLDDGVRIMSRVIGLDAADVRIGLRVRLAWDQVGDSGKAGVGNLGVVPVFVADDEASR